MENNKIIYISAIIILFFLHFLLFPDVPETLEGLETQLETAVEPGEESLLLARLSRLTRDSEPGKAVRYGKKALEVIKQHENPLLKIRVLLSLTWAYQHLGEYEIALKHAYKTETLALQKGDKKSAASAYNHISRIYYYLGFLDRSLKYALRALESSEKQKDYNNVAQAYINIGNVCMILGDNKQALKQYQKSLYFLRVLSDKRSIAVVLINIGNVYFSSRRYKNALEYYRKSRVVVEELNWQIGKAAVMGSIASVYSVKGQYKRALEINQIAIETCKKMGIKRMNAILLGNMGRGYRQLGQYQKALLYVTQALEIAKEIKNKDVLRYLYRELFNINLAQKEYLESYVFFTKSQTIENEIISKDSRKKISQILGKFTSGIQGEEILQLIQKNNFQQLKLERRELTRYFAIIVSILSIVVAGVIYNRYRIKQRTERLLKESEQRLREMNSSKDKLFSIIAHDLESPLNGLLLSSSYLEERYNTLEKKEIKEFLHQIYENTHHMAKLLDNLLQWALSQLGKMDVNLEILDLNRLVDDTLSLMESAAAGKKISLISDINENTRAWADKRMVETILRNLVANSIKYTGTGGKVTISSRFKENFLQVTVSDNGVGIPADKLNTLFNPGIRCSTRGTAGEKGIGLGLMLCKDLVEKNGGIIRAESDLAHPGTRILFTLPTDAAPERKYSRTNFNSLIDEAL